MADSTLHDTMVVSPHHPLIGIPVRIDGREVIQYFVDEGNADEAMSDSNVEKTLQLAGAWKDLDWDEMEQTLYHIRHDSTPSAPLSL